MLTARLHYLALRSPDPGTLAAFHGKATGLQIEESGHLLVGRAPGRRIIFLPGTARTLGFAALAVADSAALEALAARLSTAGVASRPAADEGLFFSQGAFFIEDPDGNALLFGVPLKQNEEVGLVGTGSLPGRLQHVVFASREAARLARFYTETLGFTLSDKVIDEDGSMRTAFLRCSEEHHSVAVFQSNEDRLDHHCYEAGDWGFIRDWGDHFASQRIPVVWGPGRHGPGNNLFMFIHDCDGNSLEISAELEVVEADRPAGVWPHEEHTLNRWGRGLLRS